MSDLYVFTDDGPPPPWLEPWIKATLERYQDIRAPLRQRARPAAHRGFDRRGKSGRLP
jgi:hypothetical protein